MKHLKHAAEKDFDDIVALDGKGLLSLPSMIVMHRPSRTQKARSNKSTESHSSQARALTHCAFLHHPDNCVHCQSAISPVQCNQRSD